MTHYCLIHNVIFNTNVACKFYTKSKNGLHYDAVQSRFMQTFLPYGSSSILTRIFPFRDRIIPAAHPSSSVSLAHQYRSSSPSFMFNLSHKSSFTLFVWPPLFTACAALPSTPVFCYLPPWGTICSSLHILQLVICQYKSVQITAFSCLGITFIHLLPECLLLY